MDDRLMKRSTKRADVLRVCSLALGSLCCAASAAADVIFDNVPFPELVHRSSGFAEDPARNADNFLLSPGQTTISEISSGWVPGGNFAAGR